MQDLVRHWFENNGREGWDAVEPVERPGIGHEVRPHSPCARTNGAQWLIFEHLSDCLVALFGMAVCLGTGHGLVQERGVQLVQAFDPKAWGEEPFPDPPDLVLDLTPRQRSRTDGDTLARPNLTLACRAVHCGAIGSSPMDGGRTRKWLHICRKRRL
jgi:hypothetical protein